MGLYFSDSRKKKVLSVLTVLLSVSVYLLYFRVILPYYSNSNESLFQGYYGHLGDSKIDVILAPLLNPVSWLKAVFTLSNLKWSFLWLASGLFIFVFRKPWILLALPDIYLILISNGENLRNPNNQYGGIILTPFILSVIMSAAYYERTKSTWKPAVLYFSLVTSVLFFKSPLFQSINDVFIRENSGLYSLALVNEIEGLDKTIPVYTNAVEVLPFAAKKR